MSDDLVAFLRARLDEDEATAKAAAEDGNARWILRDHPADSVMVWDGGGSAVVYNEGAPSDAEAAHIARYDPARVLREVEFKRWLLADHDPLSIEVVQPKQPDADFYEPLSTKSVLLCRLDDDGVWPCEAIRHLAAVYSDHPDYPAELRQPELDRWVGLRIRKGITPA